MAHKYMALSRFPLDRTQRTPVVEMSRPAAEALSGALNLARGYLVDDIARIGRSRTMTEAAKQHDLSGLRAALTTLQAFQAAHEEAHGLGGY